MGIYKSCQTYNFIGDNPLSKGKELSVQIAGFVDTIEVDVKAYALMFWNWKRSDPEVVYKLGDEMG